MEGRGTQEAVLTMGPVEKAIPLEGHTITVEEAVPWKDNHCPPACSPSSSDSQGGESQRQG